MSLFPSGRAIAAICAFTLASHSATAASASWLGTNSGTWSDSGNWSAAFPNGTTDIATFNGPSATTTTITVGTVTAQKIVFTGATLPSYTLGSGTITVSNGTIIDLQNTVTTAQTISANFDLSNLTNPGGGVPNFGSNNPGITNNSATAKLTLGGNFTSTGTGTRSLSLGGNANNITEFSGNISATLGQVSMQVQNGTGIFSGTNTFTSFSVTNANNLIVNGATTNANTIVNNSGLLGGTGSLTGAVQVSPSATGGRLGPIISPGDRTVAEAAQSGTLDISGNFTINNSTAPTDFQFQLGGSTPGDGVGHYDQLNVGGFLTLGETSAAGNAFNSTLTLSLINGFTPSSTDVFYIITSTFVSREFAGLAEGATISALGPDWRITYQAFWGGDQGSSSPTGGSSIAIYNIAPVPEPGAIGLMLGGLGFLLLSRRKRRNGL